ncbi:TraB/GumN family protein [Chitinophaga sp. NPDC101104]|uniref:TraB/GumN family protein n=1 Tax=Chitinophaga sp. NPDC101104 TaxID=3390561 RepID=UPI003D003828
MHMQLYRFVALTISALVFTLAGHSQQKDIYYQLWKITGKGLPAPSYLLGTMHTIEGAFADSFPRIGEALRQAKVYVCEAIPEPAGTDYSDVIEFPAGDSLQNYMSRADYDTLMAFFRLHLVGEEASLLPKIARLKPQGVNILIAELKGFAPASPGGQTGPYLDDYLRQTAGALGKPVLPLETVHDQFSAVVAAAGMREDASKLVSKIKGEIGATDDARQRQATLAYRSRKLPHYFNFTAKDRYALEVGIARNKKWMEKIPGIITKDPAFIAVGHDHLISKQGLIMLLRKAGYTVTNVPL